MLKFIDSSNLVPRGPRYLRPTVGYGDLWDNPFKEFFSLAKILSMSSETGNEKQIKTRMAERTPVKVLASSSHQYVCKCCNLTFSTHPIDLFGEKSKKENILVFIINITGLAFTNEDGFPNKICKPCNNLVRKFREFKDVCLQSHKEQQGT